MQASMPFSHWSHGSSCWLSLAAWPPSSNWAAASWRGSHSESFNLSDYPWALWLWIIVLVFSYQLPIAVVFTASVETFWLQLTPVQTLQQTCWLHWKCITLPPIELKKQTLFAR